MGFDREAHETEVDRNYEAFLEMLPELMKAHKGRTALFHGARIVEIFDDRQEAYREGLLRYPDHFFSIQEVTDEPLDLGLISHVRFGPA